MAYTIDLISVLGSLFDFTLKPDLAGKTDWVVLKEAFEAYERSNNLKKNHASCLALYGKSNQVPTREDFRKTIKQLLDKSLGLDVEMNTK